MPTYLLVNIGTILIPFAFSFHPKLQFHKKWKAFWLANVLSLIPFIVWDIWFTKMGIWGFNPNYLTGLNLFNLPIEEWLFFICIPYASVFTYHCFGVLIKPHFFKYGKQISLFLFVILIIFATRNPEKLYTSITFYSLSIMLVILKNKKWMSRFLFTYSVILIPFYITNGILTGSWIDEPIVWYNNNFNLGIRLGTIPVEDIFYGMLLILLNVFWYEKFQKSTPVS